MKLNFDDDPFHQKLLTSSKGMRTYRISGTDNYRVKSRSNPKADPYIIKTADGAPTFCPCPGFSYRSVCVHFVAVEKRLRRERGERIGSR